MQVGAAVGTTKDVEGAVVVGVVFDELVEDCEVVVGPLDEVVDVFEVALDVPFAPATTEVDVDVEVDCNTAPPGVRYQLVIGSWRHSPAVTPFQPLALIRSK